LTQAGLAEAAGVSRQSLVAIESGRSEPSVGLAMRIARVLERPVEHLFADEAPKARIDVALARARLPLADAARRHAVGFVGERWVAQPLPDHLPETMTQSADAVSTGAGRRGRSLELLRSPEEIRENVLLTGCAPALGLLAARLNHTTGPGRFVWLPLSSREALRALARGETHVAGVHMGSGSSEADVESVRKYLRGLPACLVTLTSWETVLASRPGRAGCLDVPDLSRRRIRIAAREPGSGARAVLERHLKSEGIAPRERLRDAVLASSHVEIARLVAAGTADVGITLRSTALAHGLTCAPVETERFDLVLSAESLHDRRVARLLDTMTQAGFRSEIASLGGHDPSNAGQTVARLGASGSART
jgi:putative molybdopterin biosynthesis protein